MFKCRNVFQYKNKKRNEREIENINNDTSKEYIINNIIIIYIIISKDLLILGLFVFEYLIYSMHPLIHVPMIIEY